MASTSNITNPDQSNNWLKRMSRASAWVVLLGVIVLIFSGWGITQTGVIYKITFGLIDRGAANTIHRETNIPLTFFFLTHVLINIKLAVARNHPSWPWLTNAVLIIIGAGLMGIMVYMEKFRLGG